MSAITNSDIMIHGIYLSMIIFIIGSLYNLLSKSESDPTEKENLGEAIKTINKAMEAKKKVKIFYQGEYYIFQRINGVDILVFGDPRTAPILSAQTIYTAHSINIID